MACRVGASDHLRTLNQWALSLQIIAFGKFGCRGMCCTMRLLASCGSFGRPFRSESILRVHDNCLGGIQLGNLMAMNVTILTKSC